MLTILAALALAGGVEIHHQERSEPHVRSEQPNIVALVAYGLAQSETFRALVAGLNGSDVVAYIRTSLTMSGGVDGYLVQRVGKGEGRRYLWIVVNPRVEHDRLISVIAHELQHALEVAEVPGAGSDEEIQALFRRIDSGCLSGRTCTETDAAITVQQRVLRELRSNPGTRPPGRG